MTEVMTTVDNFIKRRKYLPAYWLALVFIFLGLDFISGPMIRFPILYIIPVGLASWYSGRGWGLALAVAMPLFRFYFKVMWDMPMTIYESAVNFTVRVSVLVFFAFLVDRVAVYKRELEKEVQMLKGILPICSFCKKIRDQEGKWEPLEHYISDRSEAKFSHGMCPECAKKNYPDFFK